MKVEQQRLDDDRKWLRVQAATGIGFGLFLAGHLVNTLLAVTGAAVYDSMQLWLATFYQHIVLELLLLGVVLPLHIIAGVKRARIRRKMQPPADTSLRWHRRAGWFLVIVVYWHAAAVRLPAVLFDARPGFSGVAFAIEWAPLWFYPYYFLLALAGSYHLVCGARLALSRLGMRVKPLGKRQRRNLAAIAATVAVPVLLAFGGILFAIDDPMRSRYAEITLAYYDSLFK